MKKFVGVFIGIFFTAAVLGGFYLFEKRAAFLQDMLNSPDAQKYIEDFASELLGTQIKVGAFTVEECSEQEADTKGMSITDLMEEQGVPYFDIVKIDIEGSEYYVFEDDQCERWLNKTKVLVIETHDSKVHGSTKMVFSRMNKLGFQYFQHGEDYVFYRHGVTGQ